MSGTLEEMTSCHLSGLTSIITWSIRKLRSSTGPAAVDNSIAAWSDPQFLVLLLALPTGLLGRNEYTDTPIIRTLSRHGQELATTPDCDEVLAHSDVGGRSASCVSNTSAAGKQLVAGGLKHSMWRPTRQASLQRAWFRPATTLAEVSKAVCVLSRSEARERLARMAAGEAGQVAEGLVEDATGAPLIRLCSVHLRAPQTRFQRSSHYRVPEKSAPTGVAPHQARQVAEGLVGDVLGVDVGAFPLPCQEVGRVDCARRGPVHGVECVPAAARRQLRGTCLKCVLFGVALKRGASRRPGAAPSASRLR